MTDYKSDGSANGVDSSVLSISISDEMKRCYLDYAMSVIVSRALPDARDGLKPVHRRILFSMHRNGYDWNKPHRKSARVVGDVVGKYHPHAEQSIYDALVRLTQEFSMRLPLLDGQGNFGSIDADAAAAMRYTEVRFAKPAHAILEDIDKNTVDFQDNYDSSEQEPLVLPARFPNLLINGASGIAVGMATNVPPHNMGEIIDASIAYIDDPEIDPDQLCSIVQGPDFPTGGTILGRSGIRDAYVSGQGTVTLRGKVHIETDSGGGRDRESLIVTEIPYQVNKAAMVERIAHLVVSKRIEGISDIRDESNREGIRVVIEIKRDAVAEIVLNRLYQMSQLQVNFHCNMVALSGGKPQLMSLKDMLEAFTDFRKEVVTRRTKHLLAKARERAHILVGLAISVANIDEVIHLIRSAPDVSFARQNLMDRLWLAKDMEAFIRLVADPKHQLSETGSYRLSLDQANAILDLRLQRLTALGQDEIGNELRKIGKQISDYLDILSSGARIAEIIRTDLLAVKEEFSTPRRTEIVDYDGQVDDEDLIQREDMVVTVSHLGYIKRVAFNMYKAQRRGGKGRSGMSTREEDFVTRLFVASSHASILLFSSCGIVYKTKVWRLPESTPQSRGKALVNMFPLQEGEGIATIMPLPEDESVWDDMYVMFVTASGSVRRNRLSDFAHVNRAGKIAMKLDGDDGIVGVQICHAEDDVLITTTGGQSIRFPVSRVRTFTGRSSVGVRGISLSEGSRVASISILHHVDLTIEERTAYLRNTDRNRTVLPDESPAAQEWQEEDQDPSDTLAGDVHLNQISDARRDELASAEQFLLTVSENGYGKRTSSFEYRITGRGGKGITAMVVNERNGRLVASFPVLEDDEIMLISNKGRLLRCSVRDIRLAGRVTQGVMLLNLGPDEIVVAVEHIPAKDTLDVGFDEGLSDVNSAEE